MDLIVKDNVIIASAPKFIKGIFDEDDVIKWCVFDEDGNSTGCYYLYIDGQVLFTVSQLPEDFLNFKYCYTEEKGFYINPDWVEPEKPMEEKITEISEKLDLLLEMVSKG